MGIQKQNKQNNTLQNIVLSGKKGLTLVVTSFGLGFSAGMYIGTTNEKIEKNERIMELYNDIYKIQMSHSTECEEYQDKIDKLRHEIYSLKEKTLKLKSHEK